ncbi:MAG: hypothetical protein ACPG07_06605, partial [Henriciella sp.]
MTSHLAGTACIISAVADAKQDVSVLTEAMHDACAQSGIQVKGRFRKLGWRQHLSAVEADVIVTGNIGSARQAIEAILPDATDIALLADANRRKQLLISDMDSTIIHNEVIDELAIEAGKAKEVTNITEQAMVGDIN